LILLSPSLKFENQEIKTTVLYLLKFFKHSHLHRLKASNFPCLK
jgi:hypothetical protein